MRDTLEKRNYYGRRNRAGGRACVDNRRNRSDWNQGRGMPKRGILDIRSGGMPPGVALLRPRHDHQLHRNRATCGRGRDYGSRLGVATSTAITTTATATIPTTLSAVSTTTVSASATATISARGSVRASATLKNKGRR